MGSVVGQRPLADGRIITLYPQMFTLLLTVSSPESLAIGIYDESYEYQDFDAGMTAFAVWDGTGEPKDWYRHRPSHRRREGGDPAKEEVRE